MLDLLASDARVLAPTHPGFGRAPAPRELTTVDDLAYLYLDLLDTLDLRDVVVVGVSFGGWIAAEMAVKSTRADVARSCSRMRSASRPATARRATSPISTPSPKASSTSWYCRIRKLGARDYKAMPESELIAMARNRARRSVRYALVALHARSQAQGPAASHAHSHARAVGDGGPRLTKAMGAPTRRRFRARASRRSKRAGHFPHLEQPEAFARARSVAFDRRRGEVTMRVFQFTEQPYPGLERP